MPTTVWEAQAGDWVWGGGRRNQARRGGERLGTLLEEEGWGEAGGVQRAAGGRGAGLGAKDLAGWGEEP